MFNQNIHPDAVNILTHELNKDEKVLWSTRPLSKSFMIQGIAVFLFAIPWTAFSLFWIAGASGFKVPVWNGPQSLFPLFGLPFVFIGFGMLSAPLWLKRSAERSAYVITSRRAIVLRWKFVAAEITSFGPEKLTSLSKNMKKDGSGDLIFEKKDQGSGRFKSIGFIGLDDVKTVEEILLKCSKA